MLAVAPVPRRSRPATTPRRWWSASWAGRARRRRGPACSSSTVPARVGKARLPTRSSRAVPQRASSWRMCRLTAGWLRCRLSAAREKLPWRAISRRVRTWAGLRSIGAKVFLIVCMRTIVFPYRMAAGHTAGKEGTTVMGDVSIRPATPDDAAAICTHLQPGHRGPHRHARDRAAHPRGARGSGWPRAARAIPVVAAIDRRPGGRLGQPQRVQPAARLRQRGGPLGLRGARAARPRGRRRAAAAPARARAQRSATTRWCWPRFPTTTPGIAPLRAQGFGTGRRLPRAGPARRPLGGRADHGAAALHPSHGWTVVGALCVTEIGLVGHHAYGFPVFLASMEADLGASRT